MAHSYNAVPSTGVTLFDIFTVNQIIVNFEASGVSQVLALGIEPYTCSSGTLVTSDWPAEDISKHVNRRVINFQL